MSSKVSQPSLAEFELAHQNVLKVAIETPILKSNYLTKITGQEVYLKCENLQRTGAYKLRGAYNRMSKLTAAERKKGVVAASAGNHAQGVALAAKKLGIKATIFMPVGASLPKLQATENYGAEVVLVGSVFGETLKAAQEYSAKKGAIFIPPFDHVDVILGQGTVGLEIMEQLDGVDNILVAIGGGGLAAGVAVSAKLKAAAEGRKIKVIGVQAKNASPYVQSLKSGRPIEQVTKRTIADGIAVSKPGAIPFALIKKNIDKVVTVTDDEIAKAIVVLLESGAVKLKGKTVVILSGGNIDPLLMQKVIGHGLAAAERYTSISVMLPDRPGQLVETAKAIAAAHGNVVEVLHTRHGKGLEISEVELKLSVETTGHEHRQRVLKALQDAGLKARIEAD
jgi:threonine dehydratase